MISPACPACGRGHLTFADRFWRCGGCGQQVVRPQLGPQEKAAHSGADILVYGGSAGGGKSWALIYAAARHIATPGYGAIIFRRQSTQVTGPESLWEESQKLYPLLAGRSREHRLEWRFTTADKARDSIIQFSHLQHEKDKLSHQGKGYAFLGFDELTHFTEEQFWYLQSRNRSMSGVRPRTFATTNPDPKSWVRRLINWWIGEEGIPLPERDGVLRYFARSGDDLIWGDSASEVAAATGRPEHHVKSLTFIRSRLADNEILMSTDPAYEATLLSLPRVERERLHGGNWDVEPNAGDYFRADWFKTIPEPPGDTLKIVRAWDLAATPVSATNPDPDWTVGVRASVNRERVLFIEHVIRLREAPLGVERAYFNAAMQDGARVKPTFWQDPGQAGKVQIADIKNRLLGFAVDSEVARKDKTSYALPVSSSAQSGNIVLVQGPWIESYLRVLEGFPKAKHDDDVDATSLAHLKLSFDNLEHLRRLAKWR